ncbi:unnamed protein product [Amoebophrya sp. A25]|nr:unnamed protein product [Amoebophrya sp. A25]|eukprot:GSA25T00019038001.1
MSQKDRACCLPCDEAVQEQKGSASRAAAQGLPEEYNASDLVFEAEYYSSIGGASGTSSSSRAPILTAGTTKVKSSTLTKEPTSDLYPAALPSSLFRSHDCGGSSVHPSAFEDLIQKTVPFEVYFSTAATANESFFTLNIPEITLAQNVQRDPTVFYRVPLGFGLWDAAHALMVALFEGKTLSASTSIAGRSVIELGCGAAPLPGMAARVLGASEVIVTDYLPQLVAAAQENLDSNASKLMTSTSAGKKNLKISACSLPWGVDREDLARLLFPEGNKESQAKEQQEPRSKTFDVILGADVVAGDHKDEDAHRDVMRLLGKTINDLSHPGSFLVLSHTVRLPGIEDYLIYQVLQEKWDLMTVREDDTIARWRKYGRVAHNASTMQAGGDGTGKLLLLLFKKKDDGLED